MAPAGHSYFTLWRVQMFTGATILWVLITKSKRLFWAFWSKLKMASRKSHSCRAGVEAKSSVSWPKASPTSCLACHFVCTQIAPAFTFHLEGFKFKPWFLCQNVSQLAIQRDHSSRNLFTHRERNLVCWRPTCLLSFWRTSSQWGFHTLLQGLPSWLHTHMGDLRDHWSLSLGKQQKHRIKDHRPWQAYVLSDTNTHSLHLPARLYSAPTQVQAHVCLHTRQEAWPLGKAFPLVC